MEPGMILHLLRNPWGHSDDEVRQARLAAADELERWRRTVDHPGSAVQWIAEMQPQLYALRARVAEADALLKRIAADWPTLECEHVHRGKADRHGDAVACPVLRRWDAVGIDLNAWLAGAAGNKTEVPK